MAIIHGQIESLKRVRSTLESKGITRFSSIKEIDDFLSSYAMEKAEIQQNVESTYQKDLEQYNLQLIKLNELFSKKSNILHGEIDTLLEVYQKVAESRPKNIFMEILWYVKRDFLMLRIDLRKKLFHSTLKKRTKYIRIEILELEERIRKFRVEKDKILNQRLEKAVSELEYTKKTIDDLYPIIAGAVGENLVVKEIKELSDEYFLINDFSLEFYRPIYRRKEGDRIYSIQIDHLLISRAGIFIIETKNWSKKSLQSHNLRSPVDQLKRTSFALYHYLHSDSILRKLDLNSHHWGDREIPIRNLIVMIHHRPIEKFQFVEIKRLDEMNAYIRYFQPVFTLEETRNLASFLRDRQ